MKCIYNLTSFLVFIKIARVLGCGIGTHLIIAHKARNHYRHITDNYDYRKLIDRHEDAFLGGAPYPDSFYSSLCYGALGYAGLTVGYTGTYYNVSEDTHWTPFLNASINYINRQPKPWNEATEKLVVFLMGVSSHQVADVLWNSIGVDQGFLTTMGFVNFHGSSRKAGQAAYFGGDAINMYTFDINYINVEDNWYVPVEDLYNIYYDMYGTNVTDKEVIETCSSSMLLGAISEIFSIAEAFQEVADTSPFLVDNLQSYFLGGMEDMAAWSFNKWHDVVNMLENGTSACRLPHNPLFINCSTPKDKVTETSKREGMNEYFVHSDLNGLTLDDLDIKQAYRGILMKPKNKLKERITYMKKTVKNPGIKIKEKPNPVADVRRTRINYNVNETEAMFGWSLGKGDFDKDGNEDLVIGAPYYGEDENPYMGKVFIVYSSENGLPTNDILSGYFYPLNLNNLTYGFQRQLFGPTYRQSRFGFSISVMDLNQDGNLDLAVGAPSFSSKDPLGYHGTVYVYFGQGSSRFWSSPNLTITCESKYCNLGCSLSTTDVNGDGYEDLIIGSPYWSRSKNFTQNGFITAVLSDRQYSGSMTVAVETLKWRIEGDQPYGWFGHNLYSKGGVLFVDQPYFRKCEDPAIFSDNDIDSIGKLHIMNYGTKYPALKNFSMEGKYRFDMLGLASDIGDPFGNGSIVLAVGVPGAEVKGNILTLPWKVPQGGSVMLYRIDSRGEMTKIAQYDGDRRFSRFGAFVLFEDVNEDGTDDLLISAPFRNDDASEAIHLSFTGKTYGFYGGRNFPVGNATYSKNCYPVSPCPGDVDDVLFNNFYDDDEYKSYFGDRGLMIKTKNQTHMVISASRNTDPQFEPFYYQSGKVYVFNLRWNT